ncbi:MAG TPA: glycosyl transferase, partial [Bacteroidetes bacterium]|nr:glycosyl transferase [Bacteroidota bacterium]
MRRVLIITYYWPPVGGAGVQRWLKHAKYLHDYGWEPVIYTAANPDLSVRDDSLLQDVQPSQEVLRTAVWEPY